MTHAVVLIKAERGALPDLGGQLAEIEGVAEAYSVTGQWDFVAILRVRDPAGVHAVVTGEFSKLDGIKDSRDDAGVRGVLPARPRGPVLHRKLKSVHPLRPTPIIRT